jgi:putative cell wall-binding protein
MAQRPTKWLWVIVAILTVTVLLPAGGAAAADSPEQLMLRHINSARAEAGLPPMALHGELGKVAEAWSASMAERGTLEHNPQLAREVCGSWTRVDENVGYSLNRSDLTLEQIVARLHDAFMDSPGHRMHILGDFEHVGIGYEITDRVWVTVDFARGGPLWACTATASTAGTTQRITQTDPVGAAVAVSRTRFDDAGAGQQQAAHAVLSRSDVFADSLAAAPLTDVGPLLFTSSAALGSATAGELSRVLAPGATVYLLGGTSALSPEVEQAVRDRGFRPVRLGGSSRVETALRVADVVRARHPDVAQVAVARAFAAPGNPTSGWADSVAGGAWAAARGVPVVLTHSERLDPAVAAWLARVRPARSVLLGGTAALSAAVEQAVPNAFRVGGADRAATAAAIATRLWRVDTAAERQFVIINGAHAQGWAHGLVAGGVAADDGAPILMVGSHVPAPTRQLVADCSGTVTGLTVMGDTTVVTTEVLRDLEQSGNAC